MATIRDISEMAAYIGSLNEPILRSANISLVRAVTKAEAQAKRNVTKTFKGTRDRPKSGQLTAAVFSGYEFKRDKAAEGFVGVRSKKGNQGTKPYGRIHEYGGIIRPRKAKYLWIPLFGPKSSGVLGRFNNMNPREFMKKLLETKKKGETTFEHWGKTKNKAGHKNLQKKRATFSIFRSMNNELIAWYSERTGSGRSAREKGYALFLLRTKVMIPARPYIGPAVQKAWAELPDNIKREVERKGDK